MCRCNAKPFDTSHSEFGSNIEHLTAAASAIRDADVAKEVTGLKKQLLLVQTCSAMVGQSNLITEGVQLLLQ